MRPSANNQDRFDVVEILLFLWKWKFVIGGVALIGGITAFVVSSFLTPSYLSYAVLHPTNTNSNDVLVQDPQFGYDIHADRLVQVIESDIVRDSIVDLFHLARHYEIDTTSRLWKLKLQKKYATNIEATKTIRSSVVITVKDKDPQVAADIANEIARLVDIVRADIFKSNSQQAMLAAKKLYQDKYNRVRTIADSIAFVKVGKSDLAKELLTSKIETREKNQKSIRDSLSALRSRYKVYDIGNELNMLNEKLIAKKSHLNEIEGKVAFLEQKGQTKDSLINAEKALSNGLKQDIQNTEEQIKLLLSVQKQYDHYNDLHTLNESVLRQSVEDFEELSAKLEPEINSLELKRLEHDHEWELSQLYKLKEKYEKALRTYKEPLPATYVLARAEPSYIKVFPKTWLNVLLTMAFVSFFTIVVILLWEKVTSYKQQA